MLKLGYVMLFSVACLAPAVALEQNPPAPAPGPGDRAVRPRAPAPPQAGEFEPPDRDVLIRRFRERRFGSDRGPQFGPGVRRFRPGPGGPGFGPGFDLGPGGGFGPGPGFGRRRGFGPEGGPGPVPFVLGERMRRDLGLSDDQVNRLRKMESDARRSAIRNRAEQETKQLDLQELLDAPKPDRAAIDRTIRELADARAAQMKSMVDMRLGLQEVLSADQRAKLRDLGRRRFPEGAPEPGARRPGGQPEAGPRVRPAPRKAPAPSPPPQF